MKIILFFTFILLATSCQEKNKQTVKEVLVQKEAQAIPIIEAVPEKIITNDGKIESMLEEDIVFNGKLKRYFSTNEFEKVFGKADSIKLMLDEAPCNYVFENEDGSKDMEDKYLYKDGSRFENSKDKIVVDEFRFLNHNFILFKGKTLNEYTTVKDLEKLFPNASKNIHSLDVHEEGNFQVIQLKEDENNISDGHIKLFIKNGKLFYMHWWFPC